MSLRRIIAHAKSFKKRNNLNANAGQDKPTKPSMEAQ